MLFLYNPTLESIPNKENLCRNYPLPLLLPPPPIRSNTTLKTFQAPLETYLSHLQNLQNQNEPAIVANVLAPFLQSLGLNARAAHKQKGKSEIDLALLKNNNVEVIIEAKKPSNKEEMFSPTNVNCRALHECILYYLRERDENLMTPNTSLTYIIITDFYQFYIFKSSEFKRLFESRQIKSLYKNFTNKKGLFEKNPKNEDFYSELKKILSSVGFLDSVRDSKQPSNSPHTNPLNANLPQANPSHTKLSQENPPQANIEGYYFDLRNFDSLKPKELHHIATLLSPEFLHDERTLDPNAISEPFYRELLHILGLTEKEQRKIAIDESQENSFAKHIFYKLEQKIPKDSLLDSMMNLIIIWLNRILFLKLIESKLLEFNDNDTKLCFLTSHKIKDFATLEHLFFEVLAKNYDERQNVIDRGFHYLPYLNSSLFSKDEIETRLLSIGTLDSSLQIAYYPHTILQDREGKVKTGKTTFLAYLFDFLNSYAFGLESSKRDSMKDVSINNDSTNTDSRIDTQSHSTNPQTTESTIYKAQSHADSQTNMYHTHTSQTNTSHYTSKTIIKSSVLGSVFERLNGYKEGSFYTPSFITNYMCKEAIDKAVVEKFNTQYGFKATNLAELQEDIKDSIRSQRDKTQKESTKQGFKDTLLSLTLCDPSVGSGHFLVSALNYLVFIHWYLKLALQGYEENSKQHSYDIEDLQIIDDEIILLDSSYSSISYTRPKALNKTHRLQKELFTLKKEIIESCLFGVDINPISCHIAQLRLWIELLKSTYYTDIESHFHNDTFYHSNSFSCHSEPLGEESIHTESTTTQSIYNTESKKDISATPQYDGWANPQYDKEVSPRNDTTHRHSEPLGEESTSVIAKHEALKQSSHSEGVLQGKTTEESHFHLTEESIHTESSTTQSPQNSLQYTQGRQDPHTHRLETLPNIDINIKEGNSLLSYIDTKSTIDTFLENMEKREMQAKEQQDMFAMQELESFKQDTQKKFYDDYKKAKENSNEYKNAKGKEASLYKQNYENHTQRLIGLFKRNCDWYIDFYQALKDFFYQYGYINLTQLEPEIRFQIESYVEYFNFHKNINFERKNKREIDSKKLQALLKYLKTYEDAQNLSTFEWRFAFPEVLDSSGDFVGFDVIIGNPPYISSEHMSQIIKDNRHIFTTAHKKTDIYVFFYEIGLKLLKTNGFLTFITSNKFLSQDYGLKLRELLLTKQIQTIVNFNTNVFETANVETCIISLNNAFKPHNIIQIKDISSLEGWENLKFDTIDQETFKVLDNYNFRLTLTQEKLALLDKIKEQSHRLDDICFVSYGCRPCGNAKNPHLKKSDLIHTTPIGNAKPYIESKSTYITKYAIHAHDYLDYQAGKIYNAMFEELFTTHKLMAGVTLGDTNLINFVYDDKMRFCNHSMCCIVPYKSLEKATHLNLSLKRQISDNKIKLSKSYNLRLLQGILNSKVIKFYVKELLHDGLHFYPEHQKQLPIPKITESNQTLCDEIVALVDRILKVKAKDCTTDTSKLESKIDKLVYNLYNLTNEEINMIDIQAML